MLKTAIDTYGDQGRADVADLLGRFHQHDAGKAATLRKEMAALTGETLPFRVAPLGEGFRAPTDAERLSQAPKAPFGSPEGADFTAAAGMAEALAKQGDFAGAIQHLRTSPEATQPYLAAVHQLMADRNPVHAMNFAEAMDKAGMASGGGGTAEPVAGMETRSDHALQAPDPAVARDVEVVKDPDNLPGYTHWLAQAAKSDPQWADQHGRTVSRELYKSDPKAAEEMVRQGEANGIRIGLYAEGHQAEKSPAELVKTANGRHLSMGPDSGSEQCVAMVKYAVPELQGIRASDWKEGEKIKGPGDPPLKEGTALATFENGKYQNRATGNHAVVFEKYGEKGGQKGMWVVDQWDGRPPNSSFIHFDNPSGGRIRQAGNYSVIRRP
ncbi:BPSL0067 family protein [Magnetospirillum sp. UT-4]|uniref:BPSL0067 family protein n=1 Tax=Magnetospirillum sp. UT-4 TaxID=2681467 RepID=UPI00137ED305|nr:BPSL0067 family protein [Magnetospirillum sp. UT-4]CAA7620412.1 hypothetical protein MTBUT4_350053 [Magnetospirillum sp. UT-4]